MSKKYPEPLEKISVDITERQKKKIDGLINSRGYPANRNQIVRELLSYALKSKKYKTIVDGFVE